MKERYVFIFDYPEDWMIVLYENGEEIKYFNSSENNYDDSLFCAELFVENGGTTYHYKLPSYDIISDLDVFELNNQPIESLKDYLNK